MKRMLDISIAAPLLVILMPFMAVIAVMIRLRLGSPVIFTQQRPGLYGKPFVIFKFRTLTDKRDVHGALLPDDQRMTRFGTLLRKLSLDELPELWNVLKGDMSLVGPRPLLMQYLDRYSPDQFRRHDIRPGITGWAQVNGRNHLSWEKKFELDIWYVDNHSTLLDLKILVKTVIQVFRRDGISQHGHATAAEFMGSGEK